METEDKRIANVRRNLEAISLKEKERADRQRMDARLGRMQFVNLWGNIALLVLGGVGCVLFGAIAAINIIPDAVACKNPVCHWIRFDGRSIEM